jgi:hypothetical protein
MPLSARKRYFRRRIRRVGILLSLALILAAIVCGNLVYPVLAPDSSLAVSQAMRQTAEAGIGPVTSESGGTEVALSELAGTQEPIATPTMIPLPTQGQIVPPSEDAQLLYYTIAGDSLPVVSSHFGVDVNAITSPDPIEREGLITPGQLLIIPNNLEETSSKKKLLPDSEVTFSPSTVDFDIEAFVNEAGGYLSTYTEVFGTTGRTSGADIIKRVALEYSINPRLLLAFLEFNAGWVYGIPDNNFDIKYPMGYEDRTQEGLYRQAAWFASNVMGGYYGWREGRLLVVRFQDGQVVRIAPELNAGSVGLMIAFSKLYPFEVWANLLYGDANFFELHETMFGNPWIRAELVEPLIPADTQQPEMILPFETNALWAFTGGPHAAWSAADVWAALDFAPASAESGCHDSNAWVVASMPGLVVRSEYGVVVIDLDQDGYEQTGWTMLYLHVATKDRIPLGSVVEVGDRLGHPSCEGGTSTGTHIHLARRYNGEWVPADGPLPFTLSGWEARAGVYAYDGWLLKDSQIIYANSYSTFDAQITRDD